MPAQPGIQATIRLDSVFQRYDGRCPSPGFPPFGTAQDMLSRQ